MADHQPASASEPLRVLIADDSPLVRSLLARWVSGPGIAIEFACDGQEAVESAMSKGYDIAVVDWEMPRLDGLEVVRKLRGDSRTAYGHLILLTERDDAAKLSEAFEGGTDDFVRKPINPVELRARLQAGIRIATMRREILRLAQVDPLTGAYNRHAFLDRSMEVLALGRRTGSPSSLLLCGIDGFQRINEEYGRVAGDEVLRQFAAAARRVLRISDVLGRTGDADFGVLLPGTLFDGALAVAERIRAEAEGLQLHADGSRVPVTASLGVAPVAITDISSDGAFADAAAALARARELGGNAVALEG